MDWSNPDSVETKIERLIKELREIDEFFYRYHEQDDRVLYAGMLERKRDDVVRSVVLQIHTAIEDLLSSLILYCVLGITSEKYKVRLRSKRADALREMLSGGGAIGFDRKLSVAVALGLIDSGLRKRLRELNTIRNKCSHNWVLNVMVRRGRRASQPKLPLLLSRNRDLHRVPALKDFISEYNLIYVKLYGKWVS